MMVRRGWTNDLYAFYCAQVMDKIGIRIVSVFPTKTGMWEVWGQSENTIDFDAMDREIDHLIDPDSNETEDGQ